MEDFWKEKVKKRKKKKCSLDGFEKPRHFQLPSWEPGRLNVLPGKVKNPVPEHENSGFVMTRKINSALCKGSRNMLSLLFELDVKGIVAHSWYIITLDVNLILIFG